MHCFYCGKRIWFFKPKLKVDALDSCDKPIKLAYHDLCFIQEKGYCNVCKHVSPFYIKNNCECKCH